MFFLKRFIPIRILLAEIVPVVAVFDYEAVAAANGNFPSRGKIVEFVIDYPVHAQKH